MQAIAYRGKPVVSHVWRPSLNGYDDTQMRVWEDNLRDGLLLCSEDEYQTAITTGILPRRLIAHSPDDIIG